ncbi:MAG: PEGA domain-containing protein [Patescibacteria group bacterium]
MGKQIVAIILILVGAGAIGFGVFKYFQSKKPNAGLKIDATPSALVFVDNIQLGQTPVEKIFKAGEATIKLVPTGSTTSLSTYQTKVRLTSNTYTVIKRQFGDSDITSSGEVVNLEPQSGKVASLAIVTSSPDSATVMLDGQPQGFTPLLIPSIPAGDHQISLTAPGFTPYTVDAKAVLGYKLNVNVKLAGQLPEPTPLPSETSASPSASPKPKTTTLKKPYVEIKDTPTGFLRVRQTASTGAKEVGRVNPGDTYPLLDQITGWYEVSVDFTATASGWVSSQYADIFK